MGGSLQGAILESLAFDGLREPIGSIDLQTGTISGLVSARRLALLVASGLYNPSTPGPEVQRGAVIFKDSFASAAGQTPIWTPAAGKKFRLMGYWLSLTSNASVAAAAIRYGRFVDGAGGAQIGSGQHNVFEPAAAGPVGPPLYSFVHTFPGNGYLSAAANNVLQFEVQTVLATGLWLIGMWGTEE